jgi:2-dehydro-3-deoxygluconokinase
MTEIVTFGETMLRLSPEKGERIESADHLECRTAGAESNVAITAARLGAATVWLSKLPDSVLGRRVAADIRSHGVDPQVVWSEEGRQGTYYLEQAGEPRGTNVIYDRAHAAVTTATPDELRTDAVADADIFFTTGITPALSEQLYETTEALLETASKTAFDLNYRSKLWSESAAADAFDDLLPSVDILFAPERDGRSILGVSGDAESVAETLRSRYDCETVVVTRGADGAVAVTDESTVKQDAFDAETFDPIGTGDAFVGSYLAKRVDGESVDTAMEWAAATAALKRTMAGDIAYVSPTEVDAVLDRETMDIDR